MIKLGDIMLVNGNKILKNAKEKNTVVYQFNINNLEWTRIILEKCNEMNIPVILGVSEGATKYIGGYNVVASLVKTLIDELNISNDVCLHLDHGSSVESCVKAIDAGFTSVMIDASKLPLNENIQTTKKIVEYAHSKNVTVEAEIGHVGGIEDGISSNILLADFDECITFANETKIDSLAPSIGTVHGIYKGELNIDFDLIERLNNTLEIPLVMHGGSGLEKEVLVKAIKKGISKININSDLQDVWHKAVVDYIEKNPSVYDPRKVIMSGRNDMEMLIEEKINILK